MIKNLIFDLDGTIVNSYPHFVTSFIAACEKNGIDVPYDRETVYKMLKITVPDSIVGDVFGDITKRRGRVLGTDHIAGKKGYQLVEAEAPQSEMTDYPIALRAMSQGKGVFTYKFVRYEEVPAAIAQKVIAENKTEE